jgi:3-oxoacyl-[acyl-carrier protein] reductase
MQFSGKHIIVCGSTDGIGKEIAISFAQEGANLILLARDEKKILNLLQSQYIEVNKKNHLYCVTDFNNPNYSEIQRIISLVPQVDVLVTNTSGPDISNIETPAETYMKYFNNSFLFFLWLIKIALPYMSTSKAGRIINILGTTVIEPVEGFMVSSIKAAFANLSKSISYELPPHVTINNVLPGPTNTKEFDKLLLQISIKEKQSIDSIRERIVSKTTVKRIAHPSEIASVVMFLASEKASYITGSNFKVDGGFSSSL